MCRLSLILVDSGVVVGTSLSKYLLEKSRVVFQVRTLTDVCCVLKQTSWRSYDVTFIYHLLDLSKCHISESMHRFIVTVLQCTYYSKACITMLRLQKSHSPIKCVCLMCDEWGGFRLADTIDQGCFQKAYGYLFSNFISFQHSFQWVGV